MIKQLFARIRSVERVAVAMNGVLQEHNCDSVLLYRIPGASAFIVQMYDLFGGSESKLKERPRLVCTIRFDGEPVIVDDLICVTITGANGLLIQIKSGIGCNLQPDYDFPSQAGLSMLQRKIWDMHRGIGELERQLNQISNPEARVLLERSLVNMRAQTSTLERALSGTAIITEGKDRGRGAPC